MTQTHAAIGELRAAYNQAAMQLALSWELPELVDGLADILPLDEMGATGLLEQALAIAMTRGDETDRDDVLSRRLTFLSRSIETGERAAALHRAITVLVEAKPHYAELLRSSLLTTAIAA